MALVANRDYYHSGGVTEQNCLNREEISRGQEGESGTGREVVVEQTETVHIYVGGLCGRTLSESEDGQQKCCLLTCAFIYTYMYTYMHMCVWRQFKNKSVYGNHPKKHSN